MLPLEHAKRLREAFEKAGVEMPEARFGHYIHGNIGMTRAEVVMTNQHLGAGYGNYIAHAYTSDELIEWLGERLDSIERASPLSSFTFTAIRDTARGVMCIGDGPTPAIALCELCIKVLEAGTE